MHKTTTELYAPANGGFSRVPHKVKEEVVTDLLFQYRTDPKWTRTACSLGIIERRYSHGSYGCEIVRIPRDRSYRRVMRFEHMQG